MICLHSGVDNLDLAIRCRIPQSLDETLSAAKEEASKSRRPAYRDHAGLAFSVGETGARGGYAFVVDTGPMGGNWVFRRASSSDAFGARLSMRSLPLAIGGIEAARTELARVVEAFQLQGLTDSVSVARIDYAVDLLAPGFEISSANFVMHSRCNRVARSEISEQGHSGKVTSVTVGKMPGRQVILYDKREEVLQRHKVDVLEIWQHRLQRLGLPLLNLADRDASRVVRAELRAGKHHLKNEWGVTGWESLYASAPHILAETLSAIRYCTPCADPNRARWPTHPLWQRVAEEVANANLHPPEALPTELLLARKREDMIETLNNMILGCALSSAALEGVTARDLAEYLEHLGPRLRTRSAAHPEPEEIRLAKAARRYAGVLG